MRRASAPAAHAYAERYHVGGDDPLLRRVADGMAFDRDAWRVLVGEVLLFTAAEIPEFQTCEETLCLLLAAEHYGKDIAERECLPPILQAHRGSRDLTFGAVALPARARRLQQRRRRSAAGGLSRGGAA